MKQASGAAPLAASVTSDVSRRRSKRVRREAHARASNRSQQEADSERVFSALSSGAFAFLGLRDAAATLATCRTLRNDAPLALAALEHADAGRHLLRGCAGDWAFIPSPDSSRQLHAELFRGECRCDSTALSGNNKTEDVNHALLSDPRISRHGARAAQLLSLVGVLERRLLPLCYDFTSLNAFGDVCAARPVLLPLELPASNENGDGASRISRKWTPADVRVALNAKWNLLGDQFTSASSEFVHVSDVGAHWENIAVTKRTGKPSCELCDAAKRCVREYKKEANAMLRKFNEVLNAKKLKWRAEGFDAEEIHQKRSELKAKFFPEDSYPDVNFADSHDDDILADICESERFPMNPFEGMAAGFDRANDDVFNALSEQQMGLCRSLYQPLKAVLTEYLALVGQRVHRAWMNDDDGSVTSELVAGVSASGFLCGVFVTVHRAESEIPPSAVLDEYFEELPQPV